MAKTYAIFSVDPMLSGENADDVVNSEAILSQIERQSPFLMGEDWLSIPLINTTGSIFDHQLDSRGTPGVPTDYLSQLPWTRKALDFVEAEGLYIEHARLLALRPLGMFWPHKDTHPFLRLLLPIYAEGGECLYLLGGDSYLAEVGKFYYLQPDTYHTALNLSDHNRFVLCVDITVDRKVVDFAVKYADKPEPRAERLSLSERMRKAIEIMVTSLGESEPFLAGKLAVALGSCLLDGSFEVVQAIIYEGLSKCSHGRMTGDNVEELKKLLGILEKHPYYPEVDHSPNLSLFDQQEKDE